jgi:hypothetical protein
MKPNATPRQMRDGIWMSGSVSASARPGHASSYAIAALLVVVLALIATGVI